MIPRKVDPGEVEQERLRRAEELAEESGAAWADAFLPGSSGCHELLDRTALLYDMLERYILDHPACVANPAWYQLAEQAFGALWELYQQVGSDHLATEPLGRPASPNV